MHVINKGDCKTWLLRNNEYVGSPCNINLKWRSRVIIVKCIYSPAAYEKNGNVAEIANELV